MLVLFIYVSRVASNELFKFSFYIKILFFILFFILFLTQIYLIFYENLNWINLSNNINDTDNLINIIFFNNENKININKLYNNHTYIIIIILIIYLFISLVAVVKITNIFYGPLRSI